MPSDQADHHHVWSRRGLRQSEQSRESVRVHHVVLLDHLTLHLGQDGVGAAKRQQGHLQEEERKADERVVHVPTILF